MDASHIPPPLPSHLHAVDTEVYFDGRPSLLFVAPSFIKALFLIAIAVGLGLVVAWQPFNNQPKETQAVLQVMLVSAICLLVFISLLISLVGYIRWLSTRYRITNDRIEYERGVLSTTVLNLELWRVRDVYFRRSLIQFFLGLGVIEIAATDDTIPKLEIGPIRDARKIYDKLKEARLRSGRLAGPQAMGMTS